MCRLMNSNCTSADISERKPRQSLWAAVLLLGFLGQLPLANADGQLLQLDAEALDGDQLAGQSAAAGVSLDMTFQLNKSEQNALLRDNHISDSVTGDNTISDNAFSGASGITSVIQNSGNGVVIQKSTMVNVIFQQ
ncbi:hypothetical protein [Pseudomaricurvus sp. HS19]|uniref:hypothetical protein n=1 Tax=Pseudomaricurvus sp. HS19 TaxID=2692626 RepID=UPI00136880C9|nr:hypothetical protein [Pseudomaricurvus sp. HS19]MYM63406.1 hypothetical protein [Pseudomaricurvus sp. HS19]